MNNIADLITDIQKQELIEIDGSLNPESQKRIESQILKTIAESKNPKATVVGKRRLSKRLTLILAAALTMTLGLTAIAAKENEWDIALINFMGIGNANTLQLESGEVQINQSATSECIDYGTTDAGEKKDITMTATTSIGDENEVYIRIETDYELPDGFNPETDYILPEDYSLSISDNRSGYGSVFTYFAEDNKLGFLMSISNCEDINTSSLSIHMEDFYLYHDLNNKNAPHEKELLCTGSWDLNWKFHYKSGTKTYHMLRPFENNGITYYLTEVKISPISIRMEAFRMPSNRHKEYSGDWLESIHFSDGSFITIDGMDSAGMKNGMFADSYVGIEMLGNAINPENVEKLMIGGREIQLH